MTIERAREILGDSISELSDKEMEVFLSSSKRFINIILDRIERYDTEEPI